MFKIYDGRTEFYQWDLDQKLIVSDPTITEVHFCNQTEACSLVCEVYEEDGQHLVNVPNILLQDNWPIRAYAHCDCFTKASTTFEIIARTKPADYVYTETEVKTWEELNEKIEKINISGSAIIDVDALPTEDINANIFYRTPPTESCIIINGFKNPSFDGVTPKVVEVDDLPSVGEDFITTATIYLYTVDDKCYLYSAEHNAWIDANKEGFPCVVIDSEADAIESDVWYILKSGKSKIHYYTDKWNEIGESDGESGGGIILDYDTATSPEILHACKAMTELGASVYVRRGDMLYVANEGILQNEVGLISCLALSTDSDVQPPILKLRKIGLGSIRGEVIKAIDDNSLNDIFVTNETFSALDSKVDTVESIAKGANQAVSYGNYSTMITALNALPSDTYNLGQNIMIVTVEVPDLWVSEISESSAEYTYTDDETFVIALKENGSVQVGYYVLSQLETQKVDLTNYLEKGVPPSAGRPGVYGIKKDGTQTVFMADAGQAADKVALTDAYGCLKVADPRDTNDATSKKYVDNNFVKNTDEAGDGVLGLAQYAKYEGSTNKMTPGIVSYNAVFGISAFNNASWPNTLAIAGASDAIIDKQVDIYRPITVAKLSHAVKVGVTANKETLTDEEKAKATDWLGALNKADLTNEALFEKTDGSPYVTIEQGQLEYNYTRAYRVSNTAIPKEDLIGAIVSGCYVFNDFNGTEFSENYEHAITTDDMATIVEGNGGYKILIPQGSDRYIYVVSDYEAYATENGIAFNSNGIYLESYQFEGANVTQDYLNKLLLTYPEEAKIEGAHIDLTSNLDIISILKRLEALESKA